MKLLEQVRGATGVKIIVGSAFFWAWLDAMFMSMFFISPASFGFMAEMAVVVVFAVSAVGFAIALRAPALLNRLFAERRAPIVAACFGTIASLLFLCAGVHLSWIVLVVGAICGGIFMAFFELAWGAAYCHEGTRSATPYVAGGFACAILVDTPILFMIPEAASVFFALLPLISGVLFTYIDPAWRTYRRPHDAQSSSPRTAQTHLKTHLGISMTLLCAVMLVMMGFGYLQHLVSFSAIAENGSNYGIIIQVARGVVALLMFCLLITSARRDAIIYRAGLLAMIAGFMMMPFFLGTEFFWIAGAVVICGYTALDLLIWVAFSQIAHAQSREPIKTIAVMRLLSVLCTVAGFAIGIALVGNDGQLHQYVSAETTVMGYLVVIASVLIMSTEDIWVLFGRQKPLLDVNDDTNNQEEHLVAWFDEIGLTAREREIGILLAYGRTQPWIAERLSISENTVGTHVRHIYQKADVHDRQQFIDQAFRFGINAGTTMSPESRDANSTITHVT